MTLKPKRRVGKAAALVVALAMLLTLASAYDGPHSLATSAQASGIVQGIMASTPVLSYQGRLLDPATGDPKPNGTYSMSFSLYEVEALGSPKWTEIKSVPVSGGLFSTLLGDTTALNLTLFDGRPLWLGVTVGVDPESAPRMPITYAPYALYAGHAGNADTVGGQPPTNFAPSTHVHDERYYPLQDADSRFVNDNAGEIDNPDVPDGALSPAKIGGVAWTGANDGAGSGLDADLLDGQHGSRYASSVHDHWGNTWAGAGTGLTLSGGATGLTATGSANGVYGESAAGNGVQGLSTNGTGVIGNSSLGVGVDGRSDSTTGAQGVSKDGWGIYGESQTNFGGVFSSGADHSDLMLGGAVGRINTDPRNRDSELILSSNKDIVARLDNDGGGNGVLRVKNSGGADVCTVDESGTLTADKVAYSAPRVHYYSLDSEAFFPYVNVDFGNSGGCGGAYAMSSGAMWLVAAVHLPHGATVTGFEVFFADTSSSDMTVTLSGQHLTGCGYFTMAQVDSSGAAGYYSLADTSISQPIIDNTANGYHVRAYSTAWSGSSLMIKGAVITYTIAEAQ